MDILQIFRAVVQKCKKKIGVTELVLEEKREKKYPDFEKWPM